MVRDYLNAINRKKKNYINLERIKITRDCCYLLCVLNKILAIISIQFSFFYSLTIKRYVGEFDPSTKKRDGSGT